MTDSSDPIWNDLPEGVDMIELDGEVVGITAPDDIDADAANAVLAKAGLPLLPE